MGDRYYDFDGFAFGSTTFWVVVNIISFIAVFIINIIDNEKRDAE